MVLKWYNNYTSEGINNWLIFTEWQYYWWPCLSWCHHFVIVTSLITHHQILNTRSTIYATSRAGTAYWGYSTGVIFRFNGVAFLVVFLWFMFCEPIVHFVLFLLALYWMSIFDCGFLVSSQISYTHWLLSKLTLLQVLSQLLQRQLLPPQ